MIEEMTYMGSTAESAHDLIENFEIKLGKENKKKKDIKLWEPKSLENWLNFQVPFIIIVIWFPC